MRVASSKYGSTGGGVWLKGALVGVDLWKCSVSCPLQYQYIGCNKMLWFLKKYHEGKHVKSTADSSVLSLTSMGETIPKEKFSLKKQLIGNYLGQSMWLNSRRCLSRLPCYRRVDLWAV